MAPSPSQTDDDPAAPVRLLRTRARRWLFDLHRALLLSVLAGSAYLIARAVQLAREPHAGTGPRFEQVRELLVGSYVLLIAATLVVLVREARAWARRVEPSALLAPWRVLFYVLVLSTLVFVTLLQPFWKYYFHLAAGAAAGVFGLLLAVGPILARRMRPVLHGLDIVAMNVCLLLVGSEFGLRGLAWLRPSPLLARASPSTEEQLARMRFQPGQLVQGFRCDERGWLDQRPRPRGQGDLLVCSIADSFACGATHHAYHFTTVCEQQLAWCQVYNMGAACIGPREYRYILESEALAESPDAILVCIYLGNDITDSVFSPPAETTQHEFFDRETLLSYRVLRRLPRLLRERGSGYGADPTHGLTAAYVQGEQVLICPDPLAEKPSMSEETYVDMVQWRVRRTCSGMTQDYGPIFEQLRLMRRACGKVPMYVLLLPDEFQIEDSVWDAVRAHIPDLQLERHESQRVITTWLEHEGLPYLDTGPILDAVEPLSDGSKHVYHLRNSHFNRRGNEAVGRALAVFLEEQLSPLRRERLATVGERGR